MENDPVSARREPLPPRAKRLTSPETDCPARDPESCTKWIILQEGRVFNLENFRSAGSDETPADQAVS
jgi:hypothetical protein